MSEPQQQPLGKSAVQQFLAMAKDAAAPIVETAGISATAPELLRCTRRGVAG